MSEATPAARAKLTLEHIALASIGLALLILIAVGLASYISIDRFVQAYQVSQREAGVLVRLQQMDSAIHAKVAAQRGYLLTGEADFLRQRQRSDRLLEESVAGLSAAVGDDPGLSSRIDELISLVAVRDGLLDRGLQAHQQHGADAALRLILQDEGRQAMEALERGVTTLVRERQARLTGTALTAEHQAAPVIRNFFVSLVLVTLVLLTLMGLMLREMSRRRQAMVELESGEARLKAIVDTAVDAIMVIDELGIVERFNRAAERMFGYRAEEVLGRNVSMLMPSPYREDHDGYLERYRRTGEKRIIGIGREVTGQRRDGSRFPIDLAVAEFRVGAQRRFSGMIRDISERKAAEARQAELIREVEAVNEELRNFAYIASHDLKAPLRAIASLADWISVDYADKFDDDGKEQMRLLIGRVRRMDQLIDGILQYSRVGRVREQQVPVELDSVLPEIIDLLAPPPHIQVKTAPLPTVVVEPTRIRQVFQNLLSNAIRYLDKPEGHIEVGAERSGGEWRFYVRDNGPGIEERHRERIFLLFQTLQPRDRTESTGVGLPLVKKIVEMYGGRVWLESTPGEGSTFYFSLPAKLVRER